MHIVWESELSNKIVKELRLGGQLLTGGSGLLTGGRIGLNDRGNLIQSHSNLCDCWLKWYPPFQLP